MIVISQGKRKSHLLKSQFHWGSKFKNAVIVAMQLLLWNSCMHLYYNPLGEVGAIPWSTQKIREQNTEVDWCWISGDKLAKLVRTFSYQTRKLCEPDNHPFILLYSIRHFWSKWWGGHIWKHCFVLAEVHLAVLSFARKPSRKRGTEVESEAYSEHPQNQEKLSFWKLNWLGQ